MLSPAVFPAFEQAYLDVLDHVTNEFEFQNAPRGNESRECLGLSFQIADPRDRFAYLAARQVNPVFHYAEALWYLAGRNDLDMIGYYAPRMKRDSRDGVSIVGSAYGSRIFNPLGGDTVSPFDRVLSLLRTEPNSKRGVLQIFGRDELAVESNPDVSCVIALHLLEREGRLHMVCYMRANDIDRGLLADVFSFTMIQEFAAIQLGLELGTYTHHIGSAHIGDRDLARARSTLAEASERARRPAFDVRAMPKDTTPGVVLELLRHEEALRTNARQYRPSEIADMDFDPYWEQVLLMFEAKRQLVHCPADTVDDELMNALDPGLRWLMARRWPRRIAPFEVGQ
ncbi:thymidylate synthase [Kribbella sp. NPDC056345]|uniref:thymidylate synthase n=1 Tax=Kribbella sp. NPDC056345 TaxID=3345789 RepID=UPI0035E29C28